MPISLFSVALIASSVLPYAVFGTSSPKRGLVHVSPAKHPSDDKIWVNPPTDLTWYYNYQSTPSPVFVNTQLQFVPQLWGAPSSTSDTYFLDSVKSQIEAGANVTYVLGFNEPDASTGGGSGLSVNLAAETWNREIAPLRTLGVKLGAPAVTGSPSGFTWLQDFFTACNCTADFIPVHWYGNFEGLASHIGQVRAAFPNQTIWITEYALANGNLRDTQAFYNESVEYFDRIDYIMRYSYFGSFRSDVSNVGANAAMLTQDGKLTDIGSWYLGGNATGNVPKGNTSKGAAGKKGGVGGWEVVVVVAVVTGIGIWGVA